MARFGVFLVIGVGLLAAAGCGRKEQVVGEPTVEPPTAGEETAPMTPPDAPVYEGVWARETDLCSLTPGLADPSPIAFTDGEFVGYENRCRIGQVQEGTEGGYQIELICQGEGVETTEIVEVDVDGETLRMKREGGEQISYARCEKDNPE